MSDAVSWHTAIARDFAGRYRHSPAFRERESVWRDLIKRFGKGGGSVLDAGCGSGVMTVLAAQQAGSVVAFDASPAMLALAVETCDRHASANVDLRCGRFGDDAVLGNQTFDLILCSSVLEYVEIWWLAFDWLARSLEPGGTILFSMPNGSSLYRHAERWLFRLTGRPRYYRHVHAVPRLAQVEQGLVQRGFVVEDCRFYAAAPLLSPLLRRLGLARFSDTLFVVACRKLWLSRSASPAWQPDWRSAS